ncbi:WXG100 family type VII secretion target [Haloechinothrix sp. LS1_15]|uniref:WXG100 family type VII secretion target n=1 Tax=Haloechinothrix sp. LS1_15 TaxID=2652248 RepID=UPI00294ACC74|nr:WXG100 family type VII secretion target [Haloechinothrix sp. LS1_15]
MRAEPESIHALADWLDQIAGTVDDAACDAGQARDQSQAGWDGDAGDGFRAVADQLRRDGQQLADAYTAAARALREHAETIAAVRRNMAETREWASEEGLTCSDTEIHNPGAPPPFPTPLHEADTPSQAADKRAAWQLYSEWVRRAQVYHQCERRVDEDRELEEQGHTGALDSIEHLISQPYIQATDLMTGLAAGFLSRQNTWRANAAHFHDIGNRAAQAAQDAGRSAATRASNSLTAMMARARAIAAETRANTSYIGRFLERLPGRIQDFIRLSLGDFIPKNATYLRNAIPLVRNIPVVGSMITGFGVYRDIGSGTHPVRSVTAGVGGLAAGGATVGSITGPGGALAGFLVGAGTSAVVKDFGTNPQPKYANVAPTGLAPAVGAAEMAMYYSDQLKETSAGQWVTEQANNAKEWASDTASDTKDWISDQASNLKDSVTGGEESTVAPAHGDLPGETPEPHQQRPEDRNTF